MRRYTAEVEQRVRMQAHVGDWTRAGLLSPEQGAALEAELRTDLKRTNDLLRAALALFTTVIVAASVLLVFVSFDIRDHLANAVTLAVAAAACIGLVEYLVGALRLYRYGVEEALAVASILLVATSAAEIVRPLASAPVDRWWMAWLATASAAGFAVYRRYGLVYALVGAMLTAALIPVQFSLSNAVERLFAAAIFGAAFAASRLACLRHGDDYPGDDYATLQAAAVAGAYFTLNVHIADAIPWLGIGAPSVPGWFYWSSYAATWLIPAAGLMLAIREKDRSLLTVGIALALCTLVTNKPYLGWRRDTWDPMILGALLAGGAVALRRWLASGPDGQRGGFTAARILARDRDILSALATASVAWHGRGHEPPPHDAPPSDFARGRSGGAGGGAGY